MIGAVIMKIIRSTSMTSTREVTLTSAIRGSSPRWLPSPPPKPEAILDQPFPGHGANQLVRKALELTREQPHPIDINVIRDDCRNGRYQAAGSSDQRFGDARGDSSQVTRALRRDADERAHD